MTDSNVEQHILDVGSAKSPYIQNGFGPLCCHFAYPGFTPDMRPCLNDAFRKFVRIRIMPLDAQRATWAYRGMIRIASQSFLTRLAVGFDVAALPDG